MKTYDDIVEFILKYGSANLQYRTRKEILGESCDSDSMRELQSRILELPKVKKAFSVQKENGFLGNVLHGVYFDGFDTSTPFLLSKSSVESNPSK